MLGDSYGAAVVEALSRRELEKMDGEDSRLKEGGAGGQDEEALIGVYKSASTGSNGSAVKVREVGGHFNYIYIYFLTIVRGVLLGNTIIILSSNTHNSTQICRVTTNCI